MAAAFMSLALASSASAAGTYIPGSELYYYANGSGRFDVSFFGNLGYGAGIFDPPGSLTGGGDAGLTLAMYDTSGATTTASTWGLYGDHPFTNVDGPFLTGAGSAISPFVLQSDYYAGNYDLNGVCAGGPCLKVTELAEYRSDQPTNVFLTYHVANEGSSPVKFRATVAADTREGGDDRGIGFLEPGTPRIVGTDNAASGAASSFQEVSASAWSRYQEGVPSAIWREVEQPMGASNPSTGLTNTTSPDYVDKAMAVQWDNYTPPSTGLAGGASHDFQVFLHYYDYQAVTVTTPGKVLTDTNKAVTVTATVKDRNGNAVALDSDDVHYRVYSGPDAPADQNTWLTQAPGGTPNQVDITWHWLGDGSTPAANDYYTGWVDLNDDNVQQNNEPDFSGSAQWFDGFKIAPTYTSRRIGQANAFNVQSFNTSTGALITTPTFKWKVTGANPQVNGGDPDGLFTCSSACGSAIDLHNTNAGTDTITVWQDFDGTVGFDGYGEKRTVTVTWTSGITLSPSERASVPQNATFSVATTLVNSAGTAIPNERLYYTVTGDNPQDPAHGCAGTASTSGGPVANTACVLPVTSGTGQVSIAMRTANTGDDVLTVWKDDDAVAGSGPTAGDHVISTGRYSTILTPDQRLSSSAGTSNVVTRTIGNPYNLGVTLLTAKGAADATHTLRYYTDSGSIDNVDDTALTNDGSGNFTIPLADSGNQSGRDYVNYYADYNGNGQEDFYEPSGYVSVYWYKRAQISNYTDTTVFQPGYLYVDARLQHDNGTPYTGDFTWSVDGGAVTHATAYSSNFENASFDVPSQSAGLHTITVSFTDTDGAHSDSIDVLWKPQDTLTLTPAHTDASTGYRMTVTATLMRTQNGVTAPAPAGTLLRYEIYGTNDDSGKQSIETDAAGHATISWVGAKDGSDEVHVWPDYNANGAEDGDEYYVEQYTQVTFHNRVDIATNFDSAWEGNTESATVSFHDDAYNALANKPLAWQITGANPGSGTASTDGSGNLIVSWKGNEPGTDTLVVWQDTNANGQIDPDEQKSDPLQVYWYQRVTAYASCCSPKIVGDPPYTVDVYLSDLQGADQQGAVLHWTATGANPTSGNTAATDAVGHTSFQLDSPAGGTDDVVVFVDTNGNGTRDAGEPRDTFSVSWTGAVNLSAAKASTLPEDTGQTQTITATESPASGSPLKYQVFGTHPQPVTLYNGTTKIVLPGPSHGYDDVVVWADTNNNGVRDSGEKTSWFFQTWTPRIDLTPPAGNRVAGGSATVAVQMLQASGQPDTTAGVTLNYTITGANPRSGSVQTNSLGKASVTYTSSTAGGDTVTVTNGTYTNSAYVYWSAPPVSLSLTHNSASTDYQTKTHTVTAHIGAVSIPSGGYPVHFAVSGANTVADTQVQSDNAGDAQFTWTGTNDGTDTVSAYVTVGGGTGSTNTTMTWKPLVSFSSTTTDQAIGEPHTETITFVDNNGNPLPDGTDVIYQITGANPTAGQVLSRPVSAGTPARVYAKISGGQAAVTWTGTNSGTDTLDVWADTDASGTVTGTDPHATRVVTWRTATASSAPPGGGTTPIGTVSQVTPGSANDFDGQATPPAPVVAKSVNVSPVSGRVFVRLPGKKKFIELLDAEQIPVGSIVDVRKGTVALTSAQNLNGGVATAQFYAGQFQIAQKKAAKPVTDLLLYGGSFNGCGKLAGKSSAGSSQKKKIRELWGSGKGQFRTKGKYAAAAVRGTKWDVVDYCDGTLVKVAQGLVQVQPNKGKARLLKAPKSLFVPVAGLAKKK